MITKTSFGFQSTHPVRGGTTPKMTNLPGGWNFNPPTPCGVGLPGRCKSGRPMCPISIHPPRAGWDDEGLTEAPCVCIISIHPPRAGWDAKPVKLFARLVEFQSTHPVRGGTALDEYYIDHKRISIHPPRAGWDDLSGFRSDSFQISIHPPRAGWDGSKKPRIALAMYFNPPTPCGVGRHLTPPPAKSSSGFQSTHPVRGGTTLAGLYEAGAKFQSTHPVRGGTGCSAPPRRPQQHFNPPTPCGVGPPACPRRSDSPHFNPPTPCGVGHRPAPKPELQTGISIHPPRAGWDRGACRAARGRGEHFNPPTPCGVGPSRAPAR